MIILSSLNKFDNLTATEIAGAISKDRAFISRRLNELEKIGVVKSKRIRQNNQLKYGIIPKGRDLLNFLNQEWLYQDKIKEIHKKIERITIRR